MTTQKNNLLWSKLSMFLNKNDLPIGAKVGFTCSTFDLFHAGHIVMLQEAKSLCDYLICGLLTDPTVDRPDQKNKPIQMGYTNVYYLRRIKAKDLFQTFGS